MNSSKVGGGSDNIGEGLNQNANNHFVIAFTNDTVIIIVVTSLQTRNAFQHCAALR